MIEPETKPRWVRILYVLAERWDRFFSRVSSMTFWRFELANYWCRCSKCEDRRGRGLQALYKGYAFWRKI